jgi:hypothetical protein
MTGFAPRLRTLGDRLLQYQDYWRPLPFRERRPGWCALNPALAAAALALNDADTEALTSDNPALWRWASRYMPDWADFIELCALPGPTLHLPVDTGPASWHIPGRKQAQIDTFVAAIGPPAAPLLEWCAGKGHLGRHLGRRWQQSVASLEIDAELCAAGQKLADRQGLAQIFLQTDVLAPESAARLAGRHAIALHACGDLHRALLRAAREYAAEAIDLAPCCYYRSASAVYPAFNPEADLPLSQTELHLAVTETSTAGQRERQMRDIAMARKLGYLAWFDVHSDTPRTGGIKPVPASWNRLPFSDYLRAMAARDGLTPEFGADGSNYAAIGAARQREVMRLSLVRLVFRRPLEIWLALDQALFLERAGYRVTLSEFCAPSLTPRNLLISARR